MAANLPNGNSAATSLALNIPPSSTAIKVKLIDLCSIAGIPAKGLFRPPVPGFEIIQPAPSLVFLLEHPSGQRLLFDLGIRKDWENLNPAIVERAAQHGHQISVLKNVSEFLVEGGIRRESIDAVIWR